MTLDLTRPIETGLGYAVRILCKDAPGDCPLVGYIETAGDIEPMCWTMEGHCQSCARQASDRRGCDQCIGNDTYLYSFEPNGSYVIGKGTVFTGPYPFECAPDLVRGRHIGVDGVVYRISGVEHRLIPGAPKKGDMVGLLVEPIILQRES